MSTTNQHNYQLPAGYTVVRLQDAQVDDQKKLMGQVFSLLKENYPDYEKSEKQGVWLSRLYEANKAGTNTMVSAVLDEHGQVVGATVMDRYDERIAGGAVLMSYSLGHKPTPEHHNENYLATLYATKADALNNIKELQHSGVNIPAVFQEHIVGKESHAPKIAAGYALGQVPLNGSPTSIITADTQYKIPVFTADVKPDATAADIELAKNGATKANLFLADITPSDPSKPLAETVRQFAAGYAQNNSYFKDHPEQDPGYQSLIALADRIPKDATYRQAYDAAAVGAAQYLKLEPKTVITPEQVQQFAHLPDANKDAALHEVSKNYALAEAYIKGEQKPELTTAYAAKSMFETQLRSVGVNAQVVQTQLENFDKLMEKNIQNDNLDNIAAATKNGHALPTQTEFQQFEQQR